MAEPGQDLLTEAIVELREMRRSNEDFVERTDRNFEEVKAKQDRTNGDVRDLKDWRARQEGRQTITRGVGGHVGIAALAVLSSIIANGIILAATGALG